MAEVSGLLLCGGRSRRFGQEKGLVPFRGQPLVERVLARLAQVASDVWISTNQPDRYRYLHVPLVSDRAPDLGPLGGLQAGLERVAHDKVAVAACDMPFASPELLRHMLSLAAGYDVVVPLADRSAGAAPPRPYLEPLHAIYRRSCLAAIATVLERGERRITCAFDLLSVRQVTPGEWGAVRGVHPMVFRNANTPEELARMEASDAWDGPGGTTV